MSRPRPLEWLRWPRSWFRKPVSTPDPRPGEDEQFSDWPSIPSEDQPAVDEDGRTP